MAIGVPSELLRRRPDIIKAERDLAAAHGTRRQRHRRFISPHLFARLYRRYSHFMFRQLHLACRANALMPIFNSKMLEQDVEINKIQVSNFYAYQKTVLAALEEAENALSSFHCEMERSRLLEQAVKAGQESYELTSQLYRIGFKNYLDVLAAQSSYSSAQDAFLQSQVELLLDYVSFTKAWRRLVIFVA